LARRTRQQKLVGWGVLAAAVVIVTALFLITRALQGGPATQSASAASSTETAEISSVSASPAASESASPSSRTEPSSSPAEVSSSSPEASSSSPEASSSSAAAPSTITPEAPSAISVVDPDSMDQGARKAFLVTLINQGIFTGVQALDSPPKIGVTPLFEGLDLTLKQQFIAVAYAYVNNGGQGSQPLQLIDATNGKLFGTYTAGDGLKLL
jgi:hypothetical protein